MGLILPNVLNPDWQMVKLKKANDGITGISTGHPDAQYRALCSDPQRRRGASDHHSLESAHISTLLLISYSSP